MKENLINISLETSTAPIIQEVRGRDYIEYGTDDWRNLYPQFLIDLYYNSSTHAAVINSTAEMIAGEDLVITDEYDSLDTFVALKKFMANVNSKESLHQVIKKVAFDFKLQGSYALHIIWNRERTAIAEVYHVPVERVRAGRPNELGQVDTYYISADWSNVRTHKPYPIAAFNTKDRTSASQLLYTGSYSPNMDIYHTPDYLAACNWCLVDQRVAEFQLSNINSGFSSSMMISFANGIPTQEERFQIEQSIKDKFTGAENAGKFILTFSDDKTRTPEITAISPSDLDKQFLALQELLVQNILSGHRVTSKTLMGIDSTNGFSSNTDELINAANFYQNTVVRPFQINILSTLQTIFEVNNINLPVEFVQLKPITVQFDSKTIREVMTQDEVRESLGLPPLDEDEDTVEDDVKLAKVGSMITDGKELPLYETIEEAEAEAKRLGCEGYHEHTQDGNTYYMPCADHKQITSLTDCSCNKTLLNSEKTELESYLETIPDIPEDWELIQEEIVDGEHEHFDYETELNGIATEKLELASTGRQNPNARSSQDGLNKSGTAFYKVRYVYAEDVFLVNKTGTNRDFCRLMTSAKKIYRKEDIIKMGRMGVNPGFGPRGAKNYSIWKFKGGPNCQHFWLRRIYKAPPSQDGDVYYPDNVQDQKYIGYTVARSEGFTAQRNDKLVARPPKRMKNHGYLNPR